MNIKNKSIPEFVIGYYLMQIFEDTRFNTTVDQFAMDVACYVHNRPVLFAEFDGFPWHMNERERDYRKDEATSQRYQDALLCRIRDNRLDIEEPYKANNAVHVISFDNQNTKNYNSYVWMTDAIGRLVQFCAQKFPELKSKAEDIRINISNDYSQILHLQYLTLFNPALPSNKNKYSSAQDWFDKFNKNTAINHRMIAYRVSCPLAGTPNDNDLIADVKTLMSKYNTSILGLCQCSQNTDAFNIDGVIFPEQVKIFDDAINRIIHQIHTTHGVSPVLECYEQNGKNILEYVNELQNNCFFQKTETRKKDLHDVPAIDIIEKQIKALLYQEKYTDFINLHITSCSPTVHVETKIRVNGAESIPLYSADFQKHPTNDELKNFATCTMQQFKPYLNLVQKSIHYIKQFLPEKTHAKVKVQWPKIHFVYNMHNIEHPVYTVNMDKMPLGIMCYCRDDVLRQILERFTENITTLIVAADKLNDRLPNLVYRFMPRADGLCMCKFESSDETFYSVNEEAIAFKLYGYPAMRQYLEFYQSKYNCKVEINGWDFKISANGKAVNIPWTNILKYGKHLAYDFDENDDKAQGYNWSIAIRKLMQTEVTAQLFSDSVAHDSTDYSNNAEEDYNNELDDCEI